MGDPNETNSHSAIFRANNTQHYPPPLITSIVLGRPAEARFADDGCGDTIGREVLHSALGRAHPPVRHGGWAAVLVPAGRNNSGQAGEGHTTTIKSDTLC